MKRFLTAQLRGAPPCQAVGLTHFQPKRHTAHCFMLFGGIKVQFISVLSLPTWREVEVIPSSPWMPVGSRFGSGSRGSKWLASTLPFSSSEKI
jgi:hypothetical protein